MAKSWITIGYELTKSRATLENVEIASESEVVVAAALLEEVVDPEGEFLGTPKENFWGTPRKIFFPGSSSLKFESCIWKSYETSTKFLRVLNSKSHLILTRHVILPLAN